MGNGTHLQDGGQCQLGEGDAVGLAVQVLEGEVIELLHQAVLRAGGGTRQRGRALRWLPFQGSTSAPSQGGDRGRDPTASLEAIPGHWGRAHECQLLDSGSP